MSDEPKHELGKNPNYIGVFSVLIVLTAIEVGITYLPVQRVFFLIPIALLKAALVALFYMHLKMDKRQFAFIFAMGLFVGAGLILAMIALYHPGQP